MRAGILTVAAVLAFSLASCSREQRESTAHRAGKTAHELADKSKDAAKKAGHELRDAARAAREGWNEGGRKRDPKK